MLETYTIEVLEKIVYKTKLDEIRDQQIGASCGTHANNEWTEMRR